MNRPTTSPNGAFGSFEASAAAAASLALAAREGGSSEKATRLWLAEPRGLVRVRGRGRGRGRGRVRVRVRVGVRVGVRVSSPYP
jgi:hypothetical protein